MIKKLGLMGNHISRSKMGKLQLFLARQANEALQYELFDGEDIANFDPLQQLTALRQAGYHGLNVTHPYKQLIYDQVVAPLLPGHNRIGSYNTLRFIEGEVYGANTDYSGFKRGYLYKRANQLPGRVLLCGAGGVGRAVAFGLAELGAAHIYIADTVAEQADGLVSVLQHEGYNASLIVPSQIARIQCQVDGLVNCTALGMYGKPGSPFDFSQIGGQSWAFDAVYIPLKTDFIARCETAGMACMTGFDLWIFQGLDAFTLFTGSTIEATPKIINEALSWLD